ncbi:MAG: ArsR family transcriptional regulator [Phycisphaerales bacterium]|nr:MAG: ArsR family transcriptional regulator [Phycisphaerales bacterium]
MEELVDIAKALADRTRLRLLAACLDGELCACQLIALVGLPNSTVSGHLNTLKRAGLLSARREGRWMHYRLTPEAERSPAANDAAAMVRAAAEREPQLRDDQRSMKAILKLEPEELCRMQREDPGCCFSAPQTRAAARSQRVGRGRSTATGSKR